MCTAGRQGRLIQTPLCVYGREDDTLHVVGGLSWWSLKAVCSLPVCPSPPSVSPPPSLSSSSRLSRRCPSARLFRPVVNSPVKATRTYTRTHTPLKKITTLNQFPGNFCSSASLRDTCRRATDENGTRVVSGAPAPSLCCCSSCCHCCCCGVWDGQSDWTVIEAR